MSKEELLFHEIGKKCEGEKGQMFGKPCYKIYGKAFLCFFQSEMVCKADKDTIQFALTLEGSKLFDPSGKKRPMKEWVQIPFSHQEQWMAFAELAKAYVKGNY